MKLLAKIFDYLIIALVFGLIAAVVFTKLEVRDAESVSSHLAQQVDSIQKDRLKLAADLAQKEKEIELQVIVNDSLRKERLKTEKQLAILRAKHKEILDSLKNIPPDSAYKALNEVYDFGDTLPRPYPFNAPQVKSMYATAVISLQQRDEIGLLQKSYFDCGNLVNGLSKENDILESVVAVTKKDNQLLLSQSAIYKTESEMSSAKYRTSQKWNNVWKGVAAVLGLVAAFK